MLLSGTLNIRKYRGSKGGPATGLPLFRMQTAPAASAPADDEDTPLFQVENEDSSTSSAEQAADHGKHHTSPLSPGKRKGTRASMPSWDEIVFGSRGDDA